MADLHVVTGAFGYSGRAIARRLLEAGHQVRTLTGSPDRPHPFGERIEALPFDFDNVTQLEEHLRGARVLYNTYWVRFNTRWFTHAEAVANTRRLFTAARRAGVERVVHVSITNPDPTSSLEYFRDKAVLEDDLKRSGLSHAILRPAVFYGAHDILINNIAWAMRRLPVFGVFGNGRYRLQPIHVEDFATLAVEQGQARENVTIDAVGPETFTFRELAETIGEIIGCRRPVVSMPPALAWCAVWAIGKLQRDIVLTRDEIAGLMSDLLYTKSPPVGTWRLTDWARAHANTLGLQYASELARRGR